MPVNRTGKPVVAVDIGGTKFIVAATDARGKVLIRRRYLTLSQEGPKKIIRRLEAAITTAIAKCGDIRSIGIAAAAIVDTGCGVITAAPNLPHWENIKLRDILSEHFGKPVYLVNDASAAALAEHRAGAGQGLENMLYLTISTGIGGGIMIDGRLYEGTDGAAGEVGHMIVQPGGPLCNCGKRGCLEALASGTAIARMARERVKAKNAGILLRMAGGDKAGITAELAAKADRQGDKLSREVIDEAAHWLGIGLANLVNIFNPQMIVLGGGVSRMGERFLRPVRRSLKANAFKLPAGTVKVVKARFGADAEMMGAAFYCLERED